MPHKDTFFSLPKAFRRLLAVRFFCTLAGQMQAVVIGWQIYALTHSALALGLVGLAEAAPALSLAMPAGHAVDIGEPRRILRRVIAINAATAMLLAALFAAEDGAQSVGLRVGALYCVSLVSGATRAFWGPCIYALTPSLVAREKLAKAAAYMGSANQVAQMAGPALGGFAYAAFQAPTTLLLLALSLGTALALSQGLGRGVAAPATPHVRQPGDLTRGLRFVFGHEVLLSALTLDMVSVLFGGVTALLPIFADQVLHTGPWGLGLLRASPAVGATMASLVLTQVDIRRRAGVWLLSAVAGFGCCIVAFAASRSVVVGCIILAASGICDGISMMVRSLIIQLVSPPNMRGRISAVNSMFVGSSNELGELESGLVASWLGLLPCMFFGGAMCLVTVSVVALRASTLRRLDLTRL